LVPTIEADGRRITAGDVGFHFLVDALTRNGAAQLLYDMNMRDDVPGYGYQLKKGATSLAESWQALDSKSMNHLMLGHLMELLYGGLAGISQTENSVAYSEVLIAPQPVGDVKSASASFDSPYGKIVSDWSQNDGSFQLNVEVPVNTQAIVKLQVNDGQKLYERGKPVSQGNGIEIIGLANGEASILVGSGSYVFEVK
jgi:hypothetical protein